MFRGSFSHPRIALGAAVLVVAALAACSHKSPVAPEPGTPELFFNWLPSFLADQSAAQPCHEITQWLDDESNFPRADKKADLQALVDRLGNCTQQYRQTAPGYVEADETILIAIESQIGEAQAFLNDGIQFTPMIQTLAKTEETGEEP